MMRAWKCSWFASNKYSPILTAVSVLFLAVAFFGCRTGSGRAEQQLLLEIAGKPGSGGEEASGRADIPFELASIVLYDITGDGKKEIFALVRPAGHNFMRSANEGIFYILSKGENGAYTILAENSEVLGGYAEVLAPDGTELLPRQEYSSASSWKGGHRIHISYRNGKLLVDGYESYSFHWDYPQINYVQDFKNGKSYVYAARDPHQGETECYGSYIGIDGSIKIDEETFKPINVLFADFDYYTYPSEFFWNPFDVGWWQDGGSYPGDEEVYGRTADWGLKAAGGDPDEMLREAVEKSGLSLEKKAYPWTEETKENVAGLLRCPVADYYYISDYDAAVYACGEIRFYQKKITSADGYSEEWKLVRG